MEQYKVKKAYNDTQLKRMTVVDEILELTKERAEEIINYDKSLIEKVEVKKAVRKPRAKKVETVKDGE
ncbi:hypothetical protein [Macrococcoides caseolyticum]|uniref:hypothetical protein n=1 Tax=Macrococcoides caseolyticum TaxID=69966 RepID=UPI001F1998EC|nr:hypothetical protein [Macrococcus caseolyticus]MCE4957260.1 hypothetical protein [Macrococcus caseolyticus]